MEHSFFEQIAQPGMKVRAWSNHDKTIWLECSFENAGDDYKTWKATIQCEQRLKKIDGSHVILKAKGGFVYLAAYDTINPVNAVTDNSVFTKTNNGTYNGQWCVPNLSQNYQSNGYKDYYGEWTSNYDHRMVYAIRGHGN